MLTVKLTEDAKKGMDHLIHGIGAGIANKLISPFNKSAAMPSEAPTPDPTAPQA